MKLSIAIPTRERAEYLRGALATCMAIDDPDLEIVVSDNASTDATASLLARVTDPRVKVVRTRERVSMRQNFAFVLAHSTGDYVMLMGDDDAVLPGQFPRLRQVLDERRPDVLAWRALYYLWPSTTLDDGGGRLKLARPGLHGAPGTREAAVVRTRLERNAIDRTDYVPMIYHGMVARAVLDRLQARVGEVFACSVPDVYFYAAVLSVIERFDTIAHPFSVQGISPKSTGVDARQSTQDTAASPAVAFAREAATDPVVDPLPGRLPVIEMYYLNALEQANRKAFGGALAIDYPAYLGKCLTALVHAGPDKAREGVAMLRAFVRDLPGSAALTAQIERFAIPAAPVASGARTEARQRWVLPGYATGSKLVVDLKPLGAGAIDDAVRIADRLIGKRPSSWAGVVARALPAILRGFGPARIQPASEATLALKPLRAVVVGASGFVGRAVVAALRARGVEAVAVGRSQGVGGATFAADMLDPDQRRAIVAQKPDLLIQCAWVTAPPDYWHAPENEAWADATVALARDFFAAGGRRFIGLGTCAEYETPDAFERIPETASTAAAATAYGRAKARTGAAILDAISAAGASAAWLRLFHLHGPGEHTSRLVPSLARAVLQGAPAECGPGQEVRDFLAVRDAGDAIAAVALSRLTGAVNIGSGAAVTLEQVARATVAAAGRPDLLRLGARPARTGDVARLVPDVSRLQALGWQPALTLDAGLAETVAALRAGVQP